MMPIVTVFSNPKGLPTAIAQSPTFNRSESPRAAVGQGPLPSSRTTARSVRLSFPTTLAATLRPSVSSTCRVSAPSTTWALVSSSPSASKITPLPWPRCTRDRGVAVPGTPKK